ncbi:MAG TPA: UDP-N-acetylmuramoyl-L-alanyl-D-glutamate--2,6-diaminopimelate ligase [Acidimicrobiales bacterium]|nr:UDP-N-acetylmuramoyl-L-alanyl-D-glutamate--2,6-diaminopimelate ligase [Acidimicrobiales bacterium]
MNLLLDEVEVLEWAGAPPTVDVQGVEHDSRRVRPGDLFCCVPGSVADGHDHAGEAVARGAVGLLCERLVAVRPAVPQALVRPGSARSAMARAAAAFYGHPARSLTMVGVTGTNGKTTVAHLVAAVLERAGYGVTVLGTLGGVRTTPEAVELQRLLAEVRDSPTPPARRAVSMEVSSHALAQARVDGIRYDVAVFTNLSHDHLDFHGSMEAYFEAKALLFAPGRAARAVVDVDDEWGRRLAERASGAGVPVTEVGRHLVGDLVLAPGRTELAWRDRRVVTRLTGALNAVNAVVAAEAAVALGIDPEVVAEGLAGARPVPGRLEIVAGPALDGSPAWVMVDYAHTPAALEAVLEEGRRLVAGTTPPGRVLVVFGCGGDRDRAKRPAMGALARRLADVTVVTSDNPRHEDPAAIVADVVAGARGGAGGRLVVEPDRRAAIALALGEARPGDVVVVAGKGHETHLEVGGRRLPFDDRAEVAAWLGRNSSTRRAG